MEDEKKILAGRKVVDAYREAHRQLYLRPPHPGIPKEHTPLLKILIDVLEKLGFTSTEIGFEPKKTEILAKFFNASRELSIQELKSEGLTESAVGILDGVWH